MPVSRRTLRNSLGLLVFLCWVPLPAHAQMPAEANVELVRKIVSVTGARKPIRLSVRNLSSMSAADFGGLRRALDAELANRGTPQSASAQDAAEVNVTLSENVRGFLWVAQIRTSEDEKEEVVMAAFDRPTTSSNAQPAELLRIEKKLIFEQESPILDIGFIERPAGTISRLVVLDPEKVSLYARAESGWEPHKSFPVPHPRPLSRDVRGRLHIEDSSFRVYLERTECAGRDEEPPYFNCGQEEEGVGTSLQVRAEWTVDVTFVPGRNLFVPYAEGQPELAKRFPAFFSLAAVPEGQGAWWIVAAPDARLHLLAPDGTVAAELSGWGSDVAGVKAECGNGWYFLTTRAGDFTQPDAVQAFEIRDGQMIAASAPVEWPGPVTALWAVESGTTATAIVRNLKSGRYEAYTLKITCSR